MTFKMTHDEIIEMARQAGIDVGIWEKLYDDDIFGYSIGGIHENLEAFAKLVAEAAASKAVEREREACAKLCEGATELGCEYWSDVAEAIRARGSNE
jgi:hypothetical protein